MNVCSLLCTVLLLVVSARACCTSGARVKLAVTLTCTDLNHVKHTFTCHRTDKVDVVKEMCAENSDKNLQQLGLNLVTTKKGHEPLRTPLYEDDSLEDYNIQDGANLELYVKQGY